MEDFSAAHASAASEGQTTHNESDIVDLHFVAIVNHNDHIFELDGRKEGPVCHGPTGSNFKLSAAKVAEKFMQRDPNELRFSIMHSVLFLGNPRENWHDHFRKSHVKNH